MSVPQYFIQPSTMATLQPLPTQLIAEYRNCNRTNGIDDIHQESNAPAAEAFVDYLIYSNSAGE
jgi:hypothetical protein